MNKICMTDLADCLRQAMAIYQNITVNQDMVDIFYCALANYDADEVKKAFKQHLLTSKWFPKPVDIVSLIEQKCPVSTQEIIHAVENKRSILGILLYSKMNWALKHCTPAAITEHAKQCQMDWPELIQKSENCNYTDHEINLIIKNRLNPKDGLYKGMGKPDTNALELFSERFLKFMDCSIKNKEAGKQEKDIKSQSKQNKQLANLKALMKNSGQRSGNRTGHGLTDTHFIK